MINYNSSDESFVRYYKAYSRISLSKHINGLVLLTLYGKKNEFISNNILNTIIKLGYKEHSAGNNGNFGYCVKYISTNYYINFCDSYIEYDDGGRDPTYSIYMDKRD